MERRRQCLRFASLHCTRRRATLARSLAKGINFVLPWALHCLNDMAFAAARRRRIRCLSGSGCHQRRRRSQQQHILLCREYGHVIAKTLPWRRQRQDGTRAAHWLRFCAGMSLDDNVGNAEASRGATMISFAAAWRNV
jgi:hypothetical protein